MIWSLSDGTTVYLGGKVVGDSAVARGLRRESEEAKQGNGPFVLVLPPPGYERLRLDDPWYMHRWISEVARVRGLLVTGAPEVTAPAEWDDPCPAGDDAVY